MLEAFGPSSRRNRNVIAMPTGKAVTFFIIFDSTPQGESLLILIVAAVKAGCMTSKALGE